MKNRLILKGQLVKGQVLENNNSEDLEVQKEIKKKVIPVFSSVSLRVLKRNMVSKIKRRKLNKDMTELGQYFDKYIRANFERNRRMSNGDKNNDNVLRSNNALFIKSPHTNLYNTTRSVMTSKRQSDLNLVSKMVLEVPRQSVWIKKATHIERKPIQKSEDSSERKITDSLIESNINVDKEETTSDGSNKRNVFKDIEARNNEYSFKRVKFKDQNSEKNNQSKIKTHYDWREYIDGTKRLADDLDYINKKNSQTNSLFFKAPTRAMATTFSRKRIKKSKPFTQPYTGKNLQNKIKGSNDQFSRLPNQNEINKLLTSIGANKFKFGNMNFLQTKSKVYKLINAKQIQRDKPRLKTQQTPFNVSDFEISFVLTGFIAVH